MYTNNTPAIIIDTYEQWKQYEADLRLKRINQMEFDINIEMLKEKIVSVYGTLEPFYNFLLNKNKIHHDHI